MAKLIKFVIKEAKIESSDLKNTVIGLDISECTSLVDLCLILAEHFVVFGSGKSLTIMLDFINCLLDMMDKEERSLFFKEII